MVQQGVLSVRLDNVAQGIFLGCALQICFCFRAFDKTAVELLLKSWESGSLIVAGREYVFAAQLFVYGRQS